jgi:uncharacterized membrane protein YidH (DUF202 family)
MNNVLLTLVPTAIGIAISPAPLIELILVLFSKRRTVNAIAFIVTLWAVTAIVLALGGVGGQAADGGSREPSTAMGWIFAVLGLLLLAIGVRNWQNRSDTSEPAVFATVSGMGPAAVAFLAFGAVAVNPKNTVLLLAAGQTIGASSSPLWYGIGFVLMVTLPYWLAVGYALLGGQPAHERLDRMRAWLVAHNRLVLGIVCVVLGVVLLAKGAAVIL